MRRSASSAALPRHASTVGTLAKSHFEIHELTRGVVAGAQRDQVIVLAGQGNARPVKRHELGGDGAERETIGSLSFESLHEGKDFEKSISDHGDSMDGVTSITRSPRNAWTLNEDWIQRSVFETRQNLRLVRSRTVDGERRTARCSLITPPYCVKVRLRTPRPRIRARQFVGGVTIGKRSWAFSPQSSRGPCRELCTVRGAASPQLAGPLHPLALDRHQCRQLRRHRAHGRDLRRGVARSLSRPTAAKENQ